jgi:tRNA/rRNA methyltransferase
MNKLQNIRIVLSRPSHPGNIGATARAMKTMGLSKLYLVKPRKFPHADAHAMSAGCTDVLDGAQVCDTLPQALQGCGLVIGMSARRREISHPAVFPREAAQLALESEQEVALVFGNETSGMSNEELILCQRLAHIPANPEYSSLNLAAAVQVMAYELRMAAETPLPPRLKGGGKPPKMAMHDEIEGFYTHLQQTLIEIEFLNPAMPGRLMSRLRRLFTRAGFQQEEINILRGILKAVNEK